MKEIMDWIKRNSLFLVAGIVVAVVIYYFVNGKEFFTLEEEMIYAKPVVSMSPTGEEHIHGLAVLQSSSGGVKNVINVAPSGSIVLNKPPVPSEEGIVSVALNKEQIADIAAGKMAPCPSSKGVDMASGNPQFPCDKAANNPDASVTLQAWEDKTSLYVPCSLNYNYPDIYRYRILKKQDYEPRKTLARGFNYGKYTSTHRAAYNDVCSHV